MNKNGKVEKWKSGKWKMEKNGKLMIKEMNVEPKN